MSEWTIDTLRQHVAELREADSKAIATALTAQEKAVAAALAAAKEAVTKAEMASEKRFESVNEFRQTLADQTASFIPRQEVVVMRDATSEKIDALRDRLTAIENRTNGHGDSWGWLIGAIGLGAGIMAMLHR